MKREALLTVCNCTASSVCSYLTYLTQLSDQDRLFFLPLRFLILLIGVYRLLFGREIANANLHPKRHVQSALKK